MGSSLPIPKGWATAALYTRLEKEFASLVQVPVADSVGGMAFIVIDACNIAFQAKVEVGLKTPQNRPNRPFT